LSLRYLGLETSLSAGNGMGQDPPSVEAIVPGCSADG
jgi:hypothetical protein